MSNRSPPRASSSERGREESPPRRHSPTLKRSGQLSEIGAKPSSPLHFIHGSLNQLHLSSNKFDKVKKNAKGGVLITVEEIQAAFGMLDVEKSGHISLPNMRKRLNALFPDMSAKEYRFLMNNKKELNIEDLKELLLENEISNFDPVAEAFKVFDPKCDGTLDGNKLRAAFISFGFGELSDEEFEILKRVLQNCCLTK